MYETTKPDTVDIEITLLEQMKYMQRLLKYTEQIVVKYYMTPHMLGVHQNIFSSEHLSNVIDDAMKNLLR